MRILHVISGLGVGGAERNMARLVRQSRERGHECWVLSASGLGPVVNELGDTPVLACGLPRAAFGGWRRARGFARACAPDLVHGWMYHGSLLAGFLARSLSRPLLWDVRHSISSLADEKLTTRWVMRVSGWPLWQPGLVVFNSDSGRRSHARLGYDRWPSEVIPNGVEVETFAGRDRDSARSVLGVEAGATVIAWVARHHPMKDLETFAQAAARIREARPEARFVFIGRGMASGNAEVASCLGAHGLRDHSTLLGERDDLPALYPGFDLLMSSSRFGEGTSNVLLEALAAGVPCVATDVGDAGAIIGDSRQVVSTGDAAALAEAALRTLGLDAAERAALVAAGSARVAREYSMDTWLAGYLGAYERLTSGR